MRSFTDVRVRDCSFAKMFLCEVHYIALINPAAKITGKGEGEGTGGRYWLEGKGEDEGDE